MRDHYTNREQAFGVSIMKQTDIRALTAETDKRSAGDTRFNDRERRELLVGCGVTHGASAALHILSPKIENLTDKVDMTIRVVLPAFERMTGDEPYFDEMTELHNALVMFQNGVWEEIEQQILEPFSSVMELPAHDICGNPKCTGCEIAYRLSVMRSDGFMSYHELKNNGQENPTMRDVLVNMDGLGDWGADGLVDKLMDMAKKTMGGDISGTDSYLAWIEQQQEELRRQVRVAAGPYPTPLHPEASKAVAATLTSFFAPALEGAVFV